jgi:hypothetical protein
MWMIDRVGGINHEEVLRDLGKLLRADVTRNISSPPTTTDIPLLEHAIAMACGSAELTPLKRGQAPEFKALLPLEPAPKEAIQQYFTKQHFDSNNLIFTYH